MPADPFLKASGVGRAGQLFQFPRGMVMAVPLIRPEVIVTVGMGDGVRMRGSVMGGVKVCVCACA